MVDSVDPGCADEGGERGMSSLREAFVRVSLGLALVGIMSVEYGRSCLSSMGQASKWDGVYELTLRIDMNLVTVRAFRNGKYTVGRFV